MRDDIWWLTLLYFDFCFESLSMISLEFQPISAFMIHKWLNNFADSIWPLIRQNATRCLAEKRKTFRSTHCFNCGSKLQWTSPVLIHLFRRPERSHCYQSTFVSIEAWRVRSIPIAMIKSFEKVLFHSLRQPSTDINWLSPTLFTMLNLIRFADFFQLRWNMAIYISHVSYLSAICSSFN